MLGAWPAPEDSEEHSGSGDPDCFCAQAPCGPLTVFPNAEAEIYRITKKANFTEIRY